MPSPCTIADETGIAQSNDRLRIYKRPPLEDEIPHIPHGVNVIMGAHPATTQGMRSLTKNNHPFLGHVDGSSFALAHNGVI